MILLWIWNLQPPGLAFVLIGVVMHAVVFAIAFA